MGLSALAKLRPKALGTTVRRLKPGNQTKTDQPVSKNAKNDTGFRERAPAVDVLCWTFSTTCPRVRSRNALPRGCICGPFAGHLWRARGPNLRPRGGSLKAAAGKRKTAPGGVAWNRRLRKADRHAPRRNLRGSADRPSRQLWTAVRADASCLLYGKWPMSCRALSSPAL